MRVYLLRHGDSDHLLENWKEKVSRNKFIQTQIRWRKSQLTEKGIYQAAAASKRIYGLSNFILYSPLDRTRQTMQIVNTENLPTQPCPLLKEIYVAPPKFFASTRLSIWAWITLAFIKMITTHKYKDILFQAHLILECAYQKKENVLLVSHKARIESIIQYAQKSKNWKVLQKEFLPCGLSILQRID